MKLKELIENVLNYPNRGGEFNDTIYGKDLEPFKGMITNTEEFSDCDELIILERPTITENESKKVISTETFRLGENQKFKGKCYLLSMSLTPIMYDPTSLNEPVLDGCLITPTVYDPQTFEPKKKIIVEFSPELLQDGKQDDDSFKTQLRERFDRVLNNPEKYTPKGTRGVIVRGIFEKVESENDSIVTDLTGVNLGNQTHTSVFFFEYVKENPQDEMMELKLSKMNIPIRLKDKFIEELGYKSINVTRKEIEDFLKNNE